MKEEIEWFSPKDILPDFDKSILFQTTNPTGGLIHKGKFLIDEEGEHYFSPGEYADDGCYYQEGNEWTWFEYNVKAWAEMPKGIK